MTIQWRSALYGAGITILALFGGLALGVLVGNLVFNSLPGHSVMNPSSWHVFLAALPAVAGFIAGSALWGVWMGRAARSHETKRMALAGVLGFAPITLIVGLGLQVLEPIAVEQLGAIFPIHRLFTFFFVPSAFLIAGVSSYAIGIGLREPILARQLFWQVGLAAALGFLVVNVVMELAGWQVGAPGADERATMVTVLAVGDFAAAICGGAVLGLRVIPQTILNRGDTQPQTF